MLSNQNAEGAIKNLTLYNSMGFMPKEIYNSNIVAGAKDFKPELNKPIYNSAMYNAIASSATGFDAAMTTLTQIRQEIVEQVFYTVPFADYVPTKIGFGAWSDQILTYRAYTVGDDFETGIINSAISTRIAETNVALEPTYLRNNSWAKETGYSLVQINEAQRSGNWSLIEQLERSRKTNWDLGIQKIAFLGSDSDPAILGLLTQAGVFTDTTTITLFISAMDEAQFQAFVSKVVGLYFANTNYTRMPTTFLMPMTDFLGLGAAASATFPLITKLAYLEQTFKLITRNQNFVIEGIAYCDIANNANTINVNRYALYNNSMDSLQMYIPVNYTSTVIGTLNNFQFQSVAYGQFTGVQALRPLELYYFDID